MVDYYGVRVLQNYNLLNGALVYVFLDFSRLWLSFFYVFFLTRKKLSR